MSNHPSGFTAWLNIGPDAHISARHTPGGVEAIKIEVVAPDVLPAVYITPEKARELRDALTVVLAEIEQAEIHDATLMYSGGIQAYGEHLGGAS